MSYEIALEYPAEAVRETVTALVTAITTADPALLVTPTSGNAVTVEEKYAEANIAASTTGAATAAATALTNFTTGLNALTTALAGNSLGEGVEGLSLESVVRGALVACSLPVDVDAYAGGAVPPAGVLNTSSSYGSVKVDMGDFVGLVVATLELARSRTILAPNFTANGK